MCLNYLDPIFLKLSKSRKVKGKLWLSLKACVMQTFVKDAGFGFGVLFWRLRTYTGCFKGAQRWYRSMASLAVVEKNQGWNICIIPGPCIILTCDLCRSEAIHLTRSTSITVLFYYFSVEITFLYIYTIYPNTQVQYFSPGENSPNNNYFWSILTTP